MGTPITYRKVKVNDTLNSYPNQEWFLLNNKYLHTHINEEFLKFTIKNHTEESFLKGSYDIEFRKTQGIFLILNKLSKIYYNLESGC